MFEQTKSNDFKKIIQVIFSLFICYFLITPVKAIDIYYIQTALNISGWTIEAAVVEQSVKTNAPLEGLRYGQFLEDITKDIGSYSNFSSILDDAPYSINGNAKKNLALTFPGDIDRNIFGFASAKTSDADKFRADAVKNGLIFDLKTMIDICYPDRTSWELSDFKTAMTKIVSAANSKSGTFSAGETTVTISACTGLTKFYDETVTANDYITATVTKNGSVVSTYHFLYKMPKGYLGGYASSLGLPEGDSSTDVEYIHWGMLIYEAIAGSLLETPVDAANVAVGEISDWEMIIFKMLQDMINMIDSALGLWSLDELIFNYGTRGSATYVYGIFPQSWENIIWGFFMFSELLGIIILGYAIVASITQRALSTTNMMRRISAWEKIRDIAVVAVALALMPVILQLLIALSYNLAEIFTANIGNNRIIDLQQNILAGSGLIGGIIMKILSLGISIYYNFYYFMRSLTVAMLIIVAPLCLSLSVVSDKHKSIPSTWFQELMANIFIQPIHTFVFSLIIMLPVSGHKIENVLLIYATIPFTGAVKTMFFGNAGSTADSFAAKGKDATMGLVKAGVVGAASGAGAVLGNAISSKSGSNSSGKNSGNNFNGGANANNNGGTTPEQHSNNAYNQSQEAAKMNTPGGTEKTGLSKVASNTASNVKSTAQKLGSKSVGQTFNDLKNAKQNMPSVQDVKDTIGNKFNDGKDAISNFANDPKGNISNAVAPVAEKAFNGGKSALNGIKNTKMSSVAKTAGIIGGTMAMGGSAVAGLAAVGAVKAFTGKSTASRVLRGTTMAAAGVATGAALGAAGNVVGIKPRNNPFVAAGSALARGGIETISKKPAQEPSTNYQVNPDVNQAETPINPAYNYGSTVHMPESSAGANDGYTTTSFNEDDQEAMGLSNVSADKNYITALVDENSSFGQSLVAQQKLLDDPNTPNSVKTQLNDNPYTVGTSSEDGKIAVKMDQSQGTGISYDSKSKNISFTNPDSNGESSRPMVGPTVSVKKNYGNNFNGKGEMKAEHSEELNVPASTAYNIAQRQQEASEIVSNSTASAGSYNTSAASMKLTGKTLPNQAAEEHSYERMVNKTPQKVETSFVSYELSDNPTVSNNSGTGANVAGTGANLTGAGTSTNVAGAGANLTGANPPAPKAGGGSQGKGGGNQGKKSQGKGGGGQGKVQNKAKAQNLTNQVPPPSNPANPNQTP